MEYRKDPMLLGEPEFGRALSDYISGVQIRPLLKRLNVPQPVLEREFKKLCPYFKPRPSPRRGKNTSFVDVDLSKFENWTVELAYWLGFFQADGGIHDQYNSIELALSRSDRDHVIKFARFLGCSESLVKDSEVLFKSKVYPVTSCRVYNPTLAVKFFDLGIFESKSYLNVDWFRCVPEEFKKVFMVGYFDGDGGLYPNKKSLSIEFYGCQAFMVSVARLLGQELGEEPEVHPKGNIFAVRFSALNEAIRFVEIYLSLGSVTLDRKRDIAKNWLGIS